MRANLGLGRRGLLGFDLLKVRFQGSLLVLEGSLLPLFALRCLDDFGRLKGSNALSSGVARSFGIIRVRVVRVNVK